MDFFVFLVRLLCDSCICSRTLACVFTSDDNADMKDEGEGEGECVGEGGCEGEGEGGEGERGGEGGSPVS